MTAYARLARALRRQGCPPAAVQCALLDAGATGAEAESMTIRARNKRARKRRAARAAKWKGTHQ